MKKRLLVAAMCGLSALALVSCGKKNDDNNDNNPDGGKGTTSAEIVKLGGYCGVDKTMPDFSTYTGSAYRKVTTASELISAIKDATLEYTTTITEYTHSGSDADYSPLRIDSVWKEAGWNKFVAKGLYVKTNGEYVKVPEGTAWDPNSTTYTNKMEYYEDSRFASVKYSQTLTKESTVHVIEIENDIDLGWNHLSSDDQTGGFVNNFAKTESDPLYTKSTMYKTHGISQLLIQRVNDLLIYSKNGAKLTHGGFKVNYCKNVAIRNLEFDEMWQWEDASKTTTGKVGDYDSYGWAYFKIGYSQSIWIDHCSFGKSFDGIIDISNPYYLNSSTVSCAPYQGDGKSSVHISNCDFHAGSDDKDGYLYKMMEEIEEDYTAGNNNYLYYKKLRDSGLSFDEILYGIAIPQKKAFLDGDSGTEYYYNTYLRVSIENSKFTNIEDRIPKVRGGVAYMYNCIVDNSQYYKYRETLISKGAKDLFSSYGTNWKCALVSQGIVCGNGGSVAAKNCIFYGIQDLLKNNDSEIKDESKKVKTTSNGGYQLTSCIYQKGENDPFTATEFTNATPTKLTDYYFTWRTDDGAEPFSVENVALSYLNGMLEDEKTGVGCKTEKQINFLKFN